MSSPIDHRKSAVSIVTAKALAKHLKKELKPIGNTVIFSYLNQMPDGVDTQTQEKLFNAKITRIDAGTSLLTNLAFGSAMLAFYFELALASDAKEFYLLGQAGALEGTGPQRKAQFKKGEIIRPTSAISAYSAGHHYHHDEIFTRPALSKELNIAAKDTRIWSTEAMFRETKHAVDIHYDHGARAVEMETSTLFALGHHFEVPVTSYLIISDLVSAETGWQPGFQEIATQSKAFINQVCAAVRSAP